jgi:hypothetical protein
MMALTREQRIDRACRIIGTDADRDYVERVVDSVLGEEEERSRYVRRVAEGNFLGPPNKDEKRALSRLADKLGKVKESFDEPTMRHMFRLERDLDQWLAKLEKFQKLAQAVAALPPKAEGRAVMAAWGARELLEEHGLPLTVTKPRRATTHKEASPGSKFIRLAAVLYGDEDADLHNYCDRIRRERWW